MTETGLKTAAGSPGAAFSIPVAQEEPAERPSEAPPLPQPAWNSRISSYLASPRGRKITIAVRGGIVLVVLSFLIIQQLQFRDTWKDSCDYWLKVWSTVWLGRAVLQNLMVLIISFLVMMNRFILFVILLQRLQILIFFFNLGWFFYGIKPVLVDASCNSVSKNWGFTIWYYDLIMFILPYTFFCAAAFLCIPILLYCLPRATDYVHAPEPTPAGVRDKLKVVKYMDIAIDVEARQFENDEATQLPTSMSPLEGNGILNDVALTFAGVSAPVMESLKRLPGMLGLQTATPQHEPRPSESIMQPAALTVGHQGELQQQQPLPLSSLSTGVGGVKCPICFSQFEGDDDVIQMPCHPTHVFHRECLFSWFNNSQVCPVCRGNIVQLVQEENQKEESERRKEIER